MSLRRLTEKWATSYKKGEGTRDKDQTADVRENIFEKQLRKMRRLEPVDEFDKYCSEKTVDSSLLSCGALGWWKVCIAYNVYQLYLYESEFDAAWARR